MRSELERAATAARMGSQSSSAYYRGRAYARAGRPGEALRELHRARAMAPRNGQVIAELARVLLDVERPLDAQDLLDDFERAAAAEPFPLPAEFFMARAELALAFGAFDAAQDAIGRACDVGRCERDIAALAARLALASGRVDVLELPLRVLERAVGIDADAQVWVAIEAFLRGETRAASEALDSAADKGDSSDPCVLLARARARAALGRRAEAAEDYRALIQGEQLLVEAWEGLKAVTGDEAERVRAAQWLEARDMHQAALAGGWRRLHGQTEQRACARALVEASRIRARMGMRSRARSLAALARDMDRVSADAHGQVLTVFDRPEDVFQRIHSLEALIRLEPGDQDLETRRQREYQAIGFTPPDRDAP